MTAINAPTGPDRPHAGIWRGTKRMLGKLWATMLALPELRTARSRQKAPPVEYYNFPPF